MMKAMWLTLAVISGCWACGAGGDSRAGSVAAGPHQQALIPGVEPPPPPFVDDFKGEPACYVACYKSYDSGPLIEGLVRVEGSYDHRHICVPTGYENRDISAADSSASVTCNDVFKEPCGDSASCWAGGDTYSIACYNRKIPC